MLDRQSDQFNAITWSCLVELCFAFAFIVLLQYRSYFSLAYPPCVFFSLKSSRIQITIRAMEPFDLNRPIAMITAYCSGFFSFNDDDFSRPFAFFVCFTHVKIIIKHHCDKPNNACLLAGWLWLALGSFVLFIAFVQRAHIVVLHIFIFHHQVLSSIYPCTLALSRNRVANLGFIECNLFHSCTIVCCSSKNMVAQ